jgi:hypothetical protein
MCWGFFVQNLSLRLWAWYCNFSGPQLFVCWIAQVFFNCGITNETSFWTKNPLYMKVLSFGHIKNVCDKGKKFLLPKRCPCPPSSFQNGKFQMVDKKPIRLCFPSQFPLIPIFPTTYFQTCLIFVTKEVNSKWSVAREMSELFFAIWLFEAISTRGLLSFRGVWSQRWNQLPKVKLPLEM